MKASIIKIGNSHGVRIPQPILKQCGLKDVVELEVHNHELVIKAASAPRENWVNAFMAMAAKGDDKLLDSETITTSAWDEVEWEWK
jgi:antitoxin MazE